jgi:hypothetical protein
MKLYIWYILNLWLSSSFIFPYFSHSKHIVKQWHIWFLRQSVLVKKYQSNPLVFIDCPRCGSLKARACSVNSLDLISGHFPFYHSIIYWLPLISHNYLPLYTRGSPPGESICNVVIIAWLLLCLNRSYLKSIDCSEKRGISSNACLIDQTATLETTGSWGQEITITPSGLE